MTGNNIVLIRSRTAGQVHRMRLAQVKIFMWGRDIRYYQYSAGDEWHHFRSANCEMMRGEIEQKTDWLERTKEELALRGGPQPVPADWDREARVMMETGKEGEG